MAISGRRKTLFKRLYLFFIVIIVIPLLVLGYFTYNGVSEKLRDQAETNMTQVVNVATTHLEQYIRSYENSTLSLLTNLDIKEYLDVSRELNYEYYYYLSRIKEFALEPIMIRHPEVSALYVVGQDGRVVSANAGASIDFTNDYVQQYIVKLFETMPDNGQLLLLNNSIISSKQSQTITLARKIRGLRSMDYKGILAMEVRSEDLSSLWEGIELGPKGYFIIEDREGKVVYHTDSKKIGTQQLELHQKELPVNRTKSYIYDVKGEERFVIGRHSSYTNWNFLLSIPMDDLRAPILGIRSDMIWIGLATLFIALLIAYRFSQSITRPIQKLRKGMKQTEKGDWTTIPLEGRKDEIDELVISYNSMVHRLSDLLEQIYVAENTKREAELERQKAELQALQLQINPHFLYNTLETIVCFPAVQDSDEVSEIVKNMAYMLRYAVQTSLEEITVANELKHVLSYMTILKHRYGREFEIEVEIPPNYLLEKMVRLTMQPLIENVFQHAFSDGIEDKHRILIAAAVTEHEFIISVQDNGRGMSDEKLAELRSRLETKRLTEVKDGKGGIGVHNVHRRIQLVFGEAYGLKIESKLNEGTSISMYMPKS